MNTRVQKYLYPFSLESQKDFFQEVDDLNSIQDQLDREQAARSSMLEDIGDLKFKESVKYIEAAYRQLMLGKTILQ